ncbi:MAG: EamA family transporter [Nitrosomonadaceae bacterium]|nr:EamA family transporter [Nitrosomonadaceae bacterium]|tara:strand:- start:687 stop:1523 length:837 start_codon:yes stop_codon:yes gene_type:complete
MLVAGLLFSFMGVFVKLGSVYFSSTELVFYRSIIGFFIICVFVGIKRYSIITVHWKNHFWRGLSGVISLLMFFYCITILPLATAVTLSYTSPLFLTLFTTLILKEHFHWQLAVAVAVGFFGVILILDPSIQEGQWAGGLIGLAAGFLAAVAYLNIKFLGNLGEPDWRIVFYFTLISTIVTGIFMIFETFHDITPFSFLLLLGVGITATLAQLALTRAYRTGKLLIVSALAYSTVLFACIWGILIWSEVLSFMSLMGTGLIVVGGILSMKISIPTRISK